MSPAERKAAKRRAKNVQNLVSFFSGKRHTYGEMTRAKSLMEAAPEDILRIIRLYDADRTLVEDIQAYARRFKQAASEIGLEELREAADMLAVKEVMDR